MTTELIIKNAPDFSTPEKSALTLKEAAAAMEVLKKAVETELPNYSAERYAGKVDEAKKARAELNASATRINDLRKQYEKGYLQAFEGFKAVCKDTISLIDDVSARLDKIVKDAENAEKEQKKNKIALYWESTGFVLFPVEKVFNQKWLNKTAKMSDIEKEINGIQARTYKDLQTLEAFTDDVDTLKAFYLDSLDIGAAVAKAKEITAAKERAEAEAKAREARETEKQLQAQRETERQEAREMKARETVDDMAAEVLDLPKDSDPIETYILKFKARRSVLFELKKYMTEHGIQYEKL